MTIEQIKAEAKKFGKDLTDEQAEAILKGYGWGELSAQMLEEVTGGVLYKLNVDRPDLPPQYCGHLDIYMTDMPQDQK